MSSGAPAGAAAPAGGPRHITEHPHMPLIARLANFGATLVL
jgi:hypothetical protein